MNWFTGIVVFVMIWWCVFLAALPWGVRPPENPAPGHATSAPDRPMLWRKVAAATVISLVLWVAAFYVIQQEWITFRPSQ